MDLKIFGLNSYESKVYENLIKNGASTAYNLSKFSGVPSGKIYSTLASLEFKGFANLTNGNPKIFTAVSPEIIFNSIINKQKQHLKHTQEKANKLVLDFSKLSKIKTDTEYDLVETYLGHSTAFAKSISLHNQTIKYWKTVSKLTINKEHLNACSAALKRGVKILALTSIKETTPERIKIWKDVGIKVRIIDELPFRFSVYDDKGVVFRFSHENTKEYVSTHIKNIKLAKGMSSFFDNLWDSAKEN